MSKKPTYRYTAQERRAEKELDSFLRKINGDALDIHKELKNLAT